MGTPQYNYHKKIDKWRLFEDDIKVYESNREKYSGITPRQENYTFFFRWKGKQIKSCQRLADIYTFKCEHEAKNES